mmetsp:Transcript_25580/g.64895  ORF Transcript_25580/g.64895 Transcript_25580/m.64895 type:complete len:293 (+) Transcript_25580:1815-2693(+)
MLAAPMRTSLPQPACAAGLTSLHPSHGRSVAPCGSLLVQPALSSWHPIHPGAIMGGGLVCSSMRLTLCRENPPGRPGPAAGAGAAMSQEKGTAADDTTGGMWSRLSLAQRMMCASAASNPGTALEPGALPGLAAAAAAPELSTLPDVDASRDTTLMLTTHASHTSRSSLDPHQPDAARCRRSKKESTTCAGGSAVDEPEVDATGWPAAGDVPDTEATRAGCCEEDEGEGRGARSTDAHSVDSLPSSTASTSLSLTATYEVSSSSLSTSRGTTMPRARVKRIVCSRHLRTSRT